MFTVGGRGWPVSKFPLDTQAGRMHRGPSCSKQKQHQKQRQKPCSSETNTARLQQ